MIIVKIQNQGAETDYLESSLKGVCGEGNVQVLKGNQFTGEHEINYLLSFGGGVIINQIASIIKNYMDRNKGKSVKIGDVEIKGVDENKVIEIIKANNNKKDE